MTTKTCTKCGTEKPLTEFSPHKLGRHGVESTCKVCKSQAVGARYHANKASATPPTNNGCEPLATPKTRAEKERWNLPVTQYEPLNVLRDIGPGVTAARPGAFDHEQCGSLQADGSTRPYAVAGALRSNIKRSFQFLDK